VPSSRAMCANRGPIVQGVRAFIALCSAYKSGDVGPMVVPAGMSAHHRDRDGSGAHRIGERGGCDRHHRLREGRRLRAHPRDQQGWGRRCRHRLRRRASQRRPRPWPRHERAEGNRAARRADLRARPGDQALRTCGVVSVPGVYGGPVSINMGQVVQKGPTLRRG
jgi:hypothetical protein